MKNSLSIDQKAEAIRFKLMNYALRLLAKRRYTEHQIISKFKIKIKAFSEAIEGVNLDDILEKIISRLKELNYINDSEYVEAYVTSRAKLRPRGKRLLALELKKKGISTEIVNRCFDGYCFDDLGSALKLLEKKTKSWARFDQKQKKFKAANFLRSKGFGTDDIYKAVQSCYSNNDYL